MRKMLLLAVFAHCIFFIVALALVGFQTMIVNLLLASWAYSVSLTMNECSILMYIIFLMAGIMFGAFYSYEKKEGY